MAFGPPSSGNAMIERLVADLIVIVHFAFIVFVGLGALLSLYRKWIALLHVPAALWGAAVELRRGTCPLTPLEQRLRVAAGESGYSGGFIEHYLVPIIYPSGMDAVVQNTLGALVIVVNLLIYGWLLLRHLRRAPDSPQA